MLLQLTFVDLTKMTNSAFAGSTSGVGGACMRQEQAQADTANAIPFRTAAGAPRMRPSGQGEKLTGGACMLAPPVRMRPLPFAFPATT